MLRSSGSDVNRHFVSGQVADVANDDAEGDEVRKDDEQLRQPVGKIVFAKSQVEAQHDGNAVAIAS